MLKFAGGVPVAAAIVNADVSATAAIAGTKVAPDFGSQNVATTGALTTGAATISTSLKAGTGTDFACHVRPLVGLTSTFGAFYCLPQATAPTASNPVLYSDGINASVNAPQATGIVAFTQNGSTTTFQASSTSMKLFVPTLMLDSSAPTAASGQSALFSSSGHPQAVDLAGNVGWISEVAKTLNADFTTTAATATSTNLTFAVKNGEKWRFEIEVTMLCSTSSGIRIAIGAPAASTLQNAWYLTTSTSNTTPLYSIITSLNNLGSLSHQYATSGPDRIVGTIVAGADGNVTLQIASNTAGDTSTVKAGSVLRAIRVTGV
ncbi:hypothetical protein [Labilithrix luteola]|uniref:hypothetical protein n=1 Tax=Labilithrix luteola TaxID=1391654 RepID=UPI001F0A9C33|nr:hypothetical protein [Labilithrix luteola]